jgi:DNA-directed RNA polymerase subunit L
MTSLSTIEKLSISSNDIKLSNTQYAGLKNLIPSVVNKKIIFEIHSSNCAFANGLRRSIMNEIPIRHLTVSMDDIYTTDPWIVANIIRGRIEMIPIPQDIPIGTTYSLKFENKNNTYVDVMSSEIKYRGSPISDWIGSIPICSINESYSITIDNITVSESYGYTNGRVSIGRTSYEILDIDMEKISSANADPKKFKLTLEVPGIINPKKVITKAIDSICDRLDNIDFSLAKTEYNIYKLLIHNESHTIGRLLETYIFNLVPTIDYVAMRESHPSKRECTIDIRHPEAEQICKQAIVNIKKEYNSIKSHFK